MYPRPCVLSVNGNRITQILLLSIVVTAGTISITEVYAQEDAEPSPMNNTESIQGVDGPIPIELDLLVMLRDPDIRNYDPETGLASVHAAEYINDWSDEWNPFRNDASTLFHTILMISNAGFDAVAPYHPTAVGVYSRIENRPASESETSLNVNIASVHAGYHIMLKLAPERAEAWRQMAVELGADPDDTSGLDLSCDQVHDLESPAAIGNLAAKCVIEGREHDGFNHFGYETAGVFMADTTGYTTVNTGYELVDPSRWQPLIVPLGNLQGKFGVQHFVTPQYANTEPYSDIDPREFRVPPPTSSNHTDVDLYKAQADEVLEQTAHLTDQEKVLVEFFDNKGRPRPLFTVSDNLVETVQTIFLLEMAQFDAGIITWQEKARYDAVRPVTAIGYLYGNEPVNVTSIARSGGGASEIPANQWYSYLTTGDHSEYPSATTCFCAAFAETARLHTGSDIIQSYELRPSGQIIPGYVAQVEAGSSLYEPGVTPAQTELIIFGSWSDYERKCAESRIDGGVHFRAAVEASLDVCGDVARPVYDYWQSLINGTAPMRGPAQPLDPDPLLDMPHWTGR